MITDWLLTKKMQRPSPAQTPFPLLFGILKTAQTTVKETLQSKNSTFSLYTNILILPSSC